MKVILLQDIKNFGRRWDLKNVSDGYARNFLLPKKMVEIADAEALKKIEELKKKEADKQKENLEKIQELADLLQKKQIVISAKEKEGKLFGSITAKEIVKQLKKENIKISVNAVEIKDTIREVGEYEIKIKLDHGIETQLNLIVEGEK